MKSTSLSDKRIKIKKRLERNYLDSMEIEDIMRMILRQDEEAVKELKRILMECGEVNECNDVDSQMIYIGEIFEKIDKIFGPALTEEKKN